MNGIPIDIVSDSESGATETIFLATRASGKAGEDMREAKRTFHTATQAIARGLVRQNACSMKAIALDSADPNYDVKLDALLAEQESLQIKGLELKDAAFDAASRLLVASLLENYPQERVEGYMQTMSDKEINDCVGIIETGDVPEDFMRSRVTRRSGKLTAPEDAGRKESSSETDSLRTGSKQEG